MKDSGRNNVSKIRKRTPRASPGQLLALVVAIEDRPYLFSKRYSGLHDQESYENGWQELADELNSLPDGAMKTAEQWRTVWRDYKSRSCMKLARRKKLKKKGYFDTPTGSLTEIEKRVVSLLGVKYTSDSDCPDSMAEEEEEHSNDIQARTTSPQSDAESNSNVGNTSPTLPMQSNYTPMRKRIKSSSSQDEITQSEEKEETKKFQSMFVDPLHSICDAELHETDDNDFLTVAKSNAETMRTLAIATQTQADANKMYAEAAKIQAEASKVHAEAAKSQAESTTLLAQGLCRIGDALMAFLNKDKENVS